MNSILYLLVSKHKAIFKIGITDNIESRCTRIRSLFGELDLDASCTVSGNKKEIIGLEKTLHFLLEKWRIEQSPKLDGYSEWFSIECFHKAVKIITEAATIREIKSCDNIVYGIRINKLKSKIHKIENKNDQHLFQKLDFIKQCWRDYENGTIDFVQHPERKDAWLWTINISECAVSPVSAMTFGTDHEHINLIAYAVFPKNSPSIVKLTISRVTLSMMGEFSGLKLIYEFISSELENLRNKQRIPAIPWLQKICPDTIPKGNSRENRYRIRCHRKNKGTQSHRAGFRD